MTLALNYTADKGQDVMDTLCRTVLKARWGQLKCWQHCVRNAEWDEDESESDEEKQKKEKTGSVCVVSATEPTLMFVSAYCYLEWTYLDLSFSLSWCLILSLPSSLSVLFQVKWLISRGTINMCVCVPMCYSQLPPFVSETQTPLPLLMNCRLCVCFVAQFVPSIQLSAWHLNIICHGCFQNVINMPNEVW